jgi:hypothetical protein
MKIGAHVVLLLILLASTTFFAATRARFNPRSHHRFLSDERRGSSLYTYCSFTEASTAAANHKSSS